MKVKVIAVMISSILCGSAIASDSLTEAKNEVSKAESSYSQSETNYHNTAYEAGSGVVGSSAEDQMKQAASVRAQAYANEYNAERQAEYNQEQAQKAAQEKDTQQPATVSPATVQAAKNASIQAGIDAANKANAVQTGKALTEANQHRTNVQAVAKADAIMNSYDHPVTPSKSFGDAQVKANRQRTEDQAVALADARMNEQDRQNKALGTATHKTNEQHEQPIHISASAHPAAAHAISSHLDRSPADNEAAKAAQAHQASVQVQKGYGFQNATDTQLNHAAQIKAQVTTDRKMAGAVNSAHTANMHVQNQKVGFGGATEDQFNKAAQMKERAAHNSRYAGMEHKQEIGFQGATEAQLNHAAQVKEQVAHTARYAGAIESQHEASMHVQGQKVGTEGATTAQLDHMAQVKAAVTAERKGMTNALAQAQEVQSHSMRYSGMTKQPMATLTPSKPVETVKVDSKPHNSSINVSAGSLKPDTAVTVNGKPTTAGTLKRLC